MAHMKIISASTLRRSLKLIPKTLSCLLSCAIGPAQLQVNSALRWPNLVRFYSLYKILYKHASNLISRPPESTNSLARATISRIALPLDLQAGSSELGLKLKTQNPKPKPYTLGTSGFRA